MPVLTLADSSLPRVGEQLFVYGYPGPVTNNDFLAAESAIEPTLTTGIVSAVKNSVGGWPLIQMDANINHGSSGGPVCNEKGEVVGLTTFGSLENTGGLAAGLNFAVPVAILDEYLDTAGIKPQLSQSSRLYAQGMVFFDQGHYKAALRKFGEVKKLNSTYPGLYIYMEGCKSRIKNGMDHYSGPIERVVIIMALLLGVSALVTWRGVRFSRRRP
jgi:hypothetical protein